MGNTALQIWIPNALLLVQAVFAPILASGIVALKHAFADSVRVVFIIAAPFGAVGCVASLFMGDVKNTMNYRVDAPVEHLSAKNRRNDNAVQLGDV